MKRHHLAAAFCVIFAGLSLYRGFHEGDMGRPIVTAIAFAALGSVGFCYDHLRTWLKLVMLAIPVVLLGISAYRHFVDGKIGGVILALGVLILGIVLMLYQDKSFVKEKARPYLRSVPVIVLSLLLAWQLYSLFFRHLS